MLSFIGWQKAQELAHEEPVIFVEIMADRGFPQGALRRHPRHRGSLAAALELIRRSGG